MLGAALLVSAACLAWVALHLDAKQALRNSRAASDAASGAASIQTHRNLGKAYYEQGKYAESVGEFQRVTAAGDALATDHLNLGMALVQANQLDDALGELTTARQMDAKLVAAEYNLGILFKRELRYPDAEAALKRVLDADPGDPASWFNLGAVYFAEKKLELALEANRRVVDMGFARAQNFYVASLFHTFTILTRLKRQDEAERVLKLHQQVRDKVPGISMQSPALEAGKYGAILVPVVPPVVRAPGPGVEPNIFDEITSKLGLSVSVGAAVTRESEALKPIKSSEYSLDFARRRLVPVFGGSVAVSDYDGDGHPDVYSVIGENHLFHNKGDGTFAEVTEKAGLAGLEGGIAATFADYNNSGQPSLFVAGLGGVRLFRNKGDGTFVDETQKAGLQGRPGELATQALLFDADNDGFLDLVVTTFTDLSRRPEKDSFVFPDDFPGASIHFYRNNGDGTFTENTAAAGLRAAVGRWRRALFADFDNDGYTDLLLVRDDGPPALYLNQGGGKFADKTAEAGKALSETRAVDAEVADFDHDGRFDVVLWSPSGYQVLLNRGGARFEALQGLPTIAPTLTRLGHRGAVVDVVGDGFDDLMMLDSTGRWRFMANRAGIFQEASVVFSPALWPSVERDKKFPDVATATRLSLIPASLSDPGKLDLLSVMPNGAIVVFEKRGPPSRWAEVKLSGFKSNTQGIGSTVEFKAGNFYKKVTVTEEPVRVFTGDRAKLDVVRVTWPNLIVQNAIDVATNQRLEVRESERLASSCPFLYVWDGTQYSFFTDILGASPLGELLPDGSRMRPNPEEIVRLGEVPRDQSGAYRFQVTSEMREVDYVGQLRLFAVDHPASEEIYSNEIYSSSPSPPELFAVRDKDKRSPVSAADDSGHDVLPLVRELDGRYPANFRRDRILGLADLHALTLDLGDIPHPRSLALWLKGWVFWTDSNASRALMSNRRLQMIPPYLQVRDDLGRWITVIPDMGLPSGTNRTMRVDLTGKFLSADHHVRIVTNFCVYWDRIFVTTDEERLPIARARELPLIAADLHYRGFSVPTSDPEHTKPDSFDYVRLLGEAPWNPMKGNYTRYGDVRELVRRADDWFAVLAIGDELSVEFSGRDLPRLTRGWKRDLFLYARGYAKDGEPNTSFASTVEPLPFMKMLNYPPLDPRPQDADYQRYLREYQTRPGPLLIPPLAPPAGPRHDAAGPVTAR